MMQQCQNIEVIITCQHGQGQERFNAQCQSLVTMSPLLFIHMDDHQTAYTKSCFTPT